MQSTVKLIKGVSPKKCLAYGVIVGTSAVTQQLLVTPLASGQPGADESLDKGFVGRCFILGSCWLGPSVMMYQQLAEKTFPGRLEEYFRFGSWQCLYNIHLRCRDKHHELLLAPSIS